MTTTTATTTTQTRATAPVQILSTTEILIHADWLNEARNVADTLEQFMGPMAYVETWGFTPDAGFKFRLL